MTGRPLPAGRGDADALPPLLVLTDRAAAATRGRHLTETVAAAVAGGARAVVVREKDLPAAARAHLVREVRELVAAAGGWVLAASGPPAAADGVHLAEADPMPDLPSSRPLTVGRSCHDMPGLARAAAEGCAYATLSPVFASRSKPGYGPPLGPGAFEELARWAPLPVYALGGVDAANAHACRRARAAGIAVMGAVMGAQDPAAAVRGLLRAWNAPEPAAGSGAGS